MDIDYIAIGELPLADGIPDNADVLISDQGSAERLPVSRLEADIASLFAPWIGSQGDYDILPSHSPDRIYIITEVADRIVITTMPTKTVYAVGETLDLEGLSVTADYPSGASADVTARCIFDPVEGTAFDTAGAERVTVSYSEGGSEMTVQFPITVTSSED